MNSAFPVKNLKRFPRGSAKRFPREKPFTFSLGELRQNKELVQEIVATLLVQIPGELHETQ